MVEMREPADLFEVAVRIERHSVELYVKLHDAVRSSRAKEAFSVLAAEEEKHLGEMRSLLEEAVDYTPRYVYPGEYELYVDGMAARILEPVTSVTPEEIGSAEEAIRLAVRLEEIAAEFYNSYVGKFDGRRREGIERLVAEERKHRRRLDELLQTYPAASSGEAPPPP
jgi:rubrerythrin